MTCAPTCLCRCQQMGCGCGDRDAAKRRADQRPSSGYTVPCSLCLGRGRAIFVNTPAGNRLVVMWCDTCDTKRAAA